MGRIARLLVLALGALILLQWLLSSQAGLNRDAGFFLPMARDVLRGAVPIADFDVYYPPGFIYMFAVLGERLLMSPVALKLFMLALHAVASWLIYAVLIQRGRARSEALVYALLYHAWAISLEGKLICLEPLQNLFLIAAWLALLRWPDRRGAAVAGLAAGAALMMKQYSLLLLPALTLLAFAGAGGGAGGRARWNRGLVFLACLPAAFAGFAVATWQQPVAVFRTVSSFSGQASSYAGSSLIARESLSLAPKIFDHSATQLLLPVAVAAFWLLIRERSSYPLALAVAFAGSLAPLIVRQYSHYVQLAVPWAILILSEFARAFAARWVEGPDRRRAFRETLVIAAMLVLTPLFAKSTAMELYHATSETESRTAHLAVARRVTDALPEHRDVLVINRPWLYLLADLTAPDLDYRWPTYIGFTACRSLRDRARFVVLMPFSGDDPEAEVHQSVGAARDWLLAGGLELFRSLPSPWGAPIEIYRHPPPRR